MSELKCPFCGQELDSDSQSWEYGCSNPDCETAGTMCGTKELWQELIRAKKQVDIAYAGLLGIPEADNSYIKDVTAEDTVEEMRKVK